MNVLGKMAENATEKTFSVNGKQFTNNSNYPHELALMFAYYSSLYDGKKTTATNLSVSDLLSPMRKLLYKITNPPENEQILDVSVIAKSSIGTCLHECMEQTLDHVGGYTQEKRSQVIIDGVTVSGKFDIVYNGEVKDMKNISGFAFNLLKKEQETFQGGLSMEEMYEQFPNYFKFAAQMSLYKYLNKDLITKPYGTIIFNLTSVGFDGTVPYQEMRFPLFPDEMVHEFIVNKIKIIKQHLAENTKPWCSDNERGARPPAYKLTRVGKGGVWRTVAGSKFDNYTEFREFCSQKAKAGDMEDITDAVYKLCEYCSFNNICDQK